ncbi:nucleotide-binding universal stress UspA family protein [Halarchaeum rubridurum]|uniref:Nucleotide-binding universal stress UspA family protein n=1 Tax=Halarchaeum rubridurum TaxID=489911 RepID=A0A830FL02_9EURY|nr:universal stress protein [Halarchaeum rubridurum]MBP1954428.1 nucleotide-binding universal stress UspA family protein [Halarchaeum rubridurum]GGM60925.1 hypothetical protein GCM10009017_08840 [Halarchaeum rubridurum]
MAVLTAVDGESIPSNPVREGQLLADRFEEPHVVLHVMPQDVFEEFRGSTGSGGAPFASSASYGEGDGAVGGGRGGEYTVEDAERHARGVARDVVEGTFDDADDRALVIQGRVGDPVAEILAEADRRDARYLVIGGRKRTPVGKALFGSTTQSILLDAEQPVLTVMSET